MVRSLHRHNIDTASHRPQLNHSPLRLEWSQTDRMAAVDGASGWKEEYALGIPEIDAQHEAIIASVFTLQRSGLAGRHELNEFFTLNALQQELRVHFSVEEVVMGLFDYPDRENHAVEHRSLQEYVKLILHATLHDKHPRMSGFLLKSLTEHFTITDRHYAQFILLAKAGGTLAR